MVFPLAKTHHTYISKLRAPPSPAPIVTTEIPDVRVEDMVLEVCAPTPLEEVHYMLDRTGRRYLVGPDGVRISKGSKRPAGFPAEEWNLLSKAEKAAISA